MTYGDYLTTSEMTRWILDTDIPWDRIDPALALAQPDVLDRVRASALIESFFPIFTPRALDLLWDNVAATAIYSIQLYESYKHFHVFAQYLAAVGYQPIADEEVVAVRRRNLGLRYNNPAPLLTRYMMSEHFAAHSFFKDSRRAAEPVLRHILQLVAKDEVRHCQFGYELLDDHLRRHPEHPLARGGAFFTSAAAQGRGSEVLLRAFELEIHYRTRADLERILALQPWEAVEFTHDMVGLQTFVRAVKGRAR